MKRSVMETILGAVVVLVAVMFVMFAYRSADLGISEGASYSAIFKDSAGLKAGSDVRLSGVKVGSVQQVALDMELDSPSSMRAKVTLALDPKLRLSTDSQAVIVNDGFFGDKFIDLEPGVEEEFIAPGGKLVRTRTSPGLDQLIGQMVFSAGNASAGNKANAAPAAAPAAVTRPAEPAPAPIENPPAAAPAAAPEQPHDAP